MAERILYSGQRLMETLNSVLDLSRIEANRIEIFPEPVNVCTAVKNHADLFTAAARKKGLYLKTQISDENLNALLDARFLGQIINNLVNNAIKYTERGGVTISIDLFEDKEENFVRIKVSDTGIGIPSNSLNTIFEEFRQVSEGFNRHFEGTGLGLTITKRFVTLMGGKIDVKSEVGAGSEFTVMFTLLEDQLTPAAPEEKIDKSDAKDLSVYSKVKELPEVLMVEDDVSSKDVTRLFLKGICNLSFADSGEQALNVVKERKFDAILMDINLGSGMSGKETTTQIKELCEYKDIPIIAITAFAMQGDRDEFIKAGCTHYISKPFNRESIVRLMMEVLQAENQIV